MQEEKDNVEKENYTDPRNVQAEVIGELRKEKIGRPMIVIELAILFIIVLIGLPIVNSMMQDENSVLYKFLNGSNTSSNITTKQAYLDGSKEQSLLSTTVMKSGNIILKNFSLYNNTVKMTISSFNNVINLDEEEYYFEILSSKNNSKLAAIKLTGTYDYQEKTVEFKTLTNFEEKTFDMIFADPPYFLSNDGITCSGGKMVSVNKGKWDKGLSVKEKHEFNKNWIKECYRILKDNGTIWISRNIA